MASITRNPVQYAASDGVNPAQALLNMGTYVSGIIVIVASVFLQQEHAGSSELMHALSSPVCWSVLLIGKITEIYTSDALQIR